MKIRCDCGDKNCKMAVWVEKFYNQCALWFTDKDGRDNVIYLNEESLSALIEALRTCWIEIIVERVIR